jgi:2-polyprenyl-3-methyl-5-hydroxy-6-metoxy-1,4-benzoquinol methylase
MKTNAVQDRFDAEFYRRHYRDPRTRVVTRAEMVRRAEFVAAFMRYAGLRVRSILDVGCGLGLMRKPLLGEYPTARYVGLEASDYLCRRYGWEQGSAADWNTRQRFDLVICYDVLQYLTARQASAALRNLGSWCHGVLHFGALTREDWEQHCDRRHTDRQVEMRPAAWYRKRLAPAFANAGSGLFLRHGAPAQLWELERPDGRHTRRC